MSSTGCAKLASAANWTAAAPACTKEAEGGNPVAQRLLGVMYDKGAGVPENPAEAVTWYRRAATSDIEAKFLLSHMLEIGRGTARSDAEAIVLLREAAASGWLRAQQTLAYRLENGSGIKKDETEAALWYRRAAERGDVISQQRLAELLAKGHGVAKKKRSTGTARLLIRDPATQPGRRRRPISRATAPRRTRTREWTGSRRPPRCNNRTP